MKKLSNLLIFTLLSTILWGQKTSDRQQIEALIAAESDHFYQRDFKSWASCYLDSEKVQWVCVEEGDVILEAYGANFLRKFVGDYLAANPEPLSVRTTRSDWQWRDFGKDAVWVTFFEEKQVAGKTQYFKGTRLLERQNGSWKISGMFSYPAKKT